MLCVGLMPTLFAAAQSVPATPPAGAPAPAGASAPYKPKNLKVLPDDVDLRKVMRAYSGALGVECGFCHAAPDPVTHRPDPRREAPLHLRSATTAGGQPTARSASRSNASCGDASIELRIFSELIR